MDAGWTVGKVGGVRLGYAGLQAPGTVTLGSGSLIR
jgi:hypothetical protein